MSKKRRKRKNSNYQIEKKEPPKKKDIFLQKLLKNRVQITSGALALAFTITGCQAIKTFKQKQVEKQAEEQASITIKTPNNRSSLKEAESCYSIFNHEEFLFPEIKEKIVEDVDDFYQEEIRKEQEEICKQQEIERQATYDEYLRIYCQYFNFDELKVIALARQLTHNYELSFDTIIDSEHYNLDNPENACMLFVYHLYNKKYLSLEKDKYSDYFQSLTISDEIVTLQNGIYLPDGRTYTEFLNQVCDLLEMDHTYPTAISYTETGRLSSNLAQTQNNFGGLRNKNGFLSYPSPEAGVIAFCTNLKNYERYNLKSIEQLSGVYVHGKRSEKSDTWIKNVRAFQKQISEEESVEKENKQTLTLEM